MFKNMEHSSTRLIERSSAEMAGDETRSGSDENGAQAGGSIGKAVRLLRAFVEGQESWGVRELAAALDQPVSSTHRMLKILRNEGLVVWDGDLQRYRSGLELHRWAAMLRTQFKFPEIVRPAMQRIADELNESCWFSAHDPEAQESWWALDVACEQPLRLTAPIGERAPLTDTAAGISIIAAMPDADREQLISRLGRPDRMVTERLAMARASGFALTVSARDDEPSLIAVAVQDARRQPIGSLAVAIPAYRFHAEDLSRITDLLKEAAERVSNVLAMRVLAGSVKPDPIPASSASDAWWRVASTCRNSSHGRREDIEN